MYLLSKEITSLRWSTNFNILIISIVFAQEAKVRKLVMDETLTIRKFKGDGEALPQKMCFATFSKLTTCSFFCNFVLIFCLLILAFLDTISISS